MAEVKSRGIFLENRLFISGFKKMDLSQQYLTIRSFSMSLKGIERFSWKVSWRSEKSTGFIWFKEWLEYTKDQSNMS